MQFNRFSNDTAKSFVVLDEEFKVLYRGNIGSNSRFELVRQQNGLTNDKQRKNYLSTISEVVCDEKVSFSRLGRFLYLAVLSYDERRKSYKELRTSPMMSNDKLESAVTKSQFRDIVVCSSQRS